MGAVVLRRHQITLMRLTLRGPASSLTWYRALPIKGFPFLPLPSLLACSVLLFPFFFFFLQSICVVHVTLRENKKWKVPFILVGVFLGWGVVG